MNKENRQFWYRFWNYHWPRFWGLHMVWVIVFGAILSAVAVKVIMGHPLLRWLGLSSAIIPFGMVCIKTGSIPKVSPGQFSEDFARAIGVIFLMIGILCCCIFIVEFIDAIMMFYEDSNGVRASGRW